MVTPQTLREQTLISLRPRQVLDIGCGRGERSRTLCAHGGRVTAVDIAPGLISRWSALPPTPNLAFCCTDANRLAFSDRTFDLVVVKSSLHHVEAWRPVVDEALRVASPFALFEEPVDDHRSAEKENTIRARQLYLELQSEIGDPHFPHLDPETLLGHLQTRAHILRLELRRKDDRVSFDAYFEGFSRQAARSRRPDYWVQRCAQLRADLGAPWLCQDDTFAVLVRTLEHD